MSHSNSPSEIIERGVMIIGESGQNKEENIHATKASKPKISRMKLMLIILAVILSLASLIVCIVLFLGADKGTKIDEYQETQYTLKVKTTITSKVGTSTTSNHDSLDMTIFSLDMKGQKYNLLIVNGVYTYDEQDTSLGSAPDDIFMSFDVSKNGEILESRYFQNKFSNETVTLMTGIIQAFVVDQDSEFEVDSECKKTKKGSTECTKNSKYKEGKKTSFKRQGRDKESSNDSEEELEYTTHTLINEHGKVEGSKIEGKFYKIYKHDDEQEQVEFEVKADIIVVSSTKLTEEQIKVLNEIDKKLPEVEFESKQKQKKFINEVTEEPNEIDDSDFPESLSLPSHLKRSLSKGYERSLFDNTFNNTYFSIYDLPFYLYSRIYSTYDKNNKYWVCGIHRFYFKPIDIKLLSTDFCISSNLVKVSPKTAQKKLAQIATLKAYVYTVKFSIFTIALSAKIDVNSLPFLETYLNKDVNTVTKLNIVAVIAVTIAGEATVGVSKAGVTFTNSIKSNVNDYMVGYKAPFSALASLDKSFEGKFQIWVKNVILLKSCYNIFGIIFCIPSVSYSDKVSLFTQVYTYKYYPEEQIFYSAF